MLISPNLTISPDGTHEYVELGYDLCGKYYTVTKHHSTIQDGVHLQADKKLMLTIEQAGKLRDELNAFFGAHERH